MKRGMKMAKQTDKEYSPLLARALENASKYPARNNLIAPIGYNDGGSYSDGYGDAGYGDQSYGEGPNG